MNGSEAIIHKGICMNSTELANGMMYVDSICMQHQQLRQMVDYEYFYRNKKKSHSYMINEETPLTEKSNVGVFRPSRTVYEYEDIVEFPIESYDVLYKKTQAVLSIEQGFLVFSNTPLFDWEIYRERILKGLKKITSSLVTFVYSDNTILPILEDAGFKKERVDREKGKILYRLSIERS